MCGCMAAQVKVRECGLGLLQSVCTPALSMTTALLKANVALNK